MCNRFEFAAKKRAQIQQQRKKTIFLSIDKRLNEIMAEENDPVMAEVMNMFESEPTSSPAAAPGPDIPALRKQLAILVSTWKCKEAIGAQLTHEQVKRLTDKEVMMAYKRYETYVGAKTTETLIEGFLSFATKALGMAVKIKDADALQNDLKKDYIITKELSELSGSLALRCGRLLALANAFLITAKHVDFGAKDTTSHHPSRDVDGYPLAGFDEVDKAKQSSASAE